MNKKESSNKDQMSLQPKKSKTQSKIDRKLAQISQAYDAHTVPLSRNQLQEQQRLQLQEECFSFQNVISYSKQILEIPPEQIMYFVQKYYLLFVSNSIQKQIGDKTIEIIDIKTKAYNEQEDQLFATHKLIHNTFRRGLCLCRQDGKIRILRRGLKKFFDLYITPECFKIQQNLIKHSLHDYAFNNLPLDQQLQITVMEKLNGENAQISYDIDLNLWVIGSKNVTILCGKSSDLKNYHGDETEQNRERYAIKIAEQWFLFLNQSDQQEQLKQLLSSYTLIGEYCGNEEYQHLVKYDKVELIFYSLVNKKYINNQTCLHPLKALEKLNQVKVKCAKAKCYQVANHQELQERLNEIAITIQKSSIQDQGEGSVIYISGLLNHDEEDQPTYSLLKIKTLDYRLKRKIREKLKGLINRNQDVQKLLEKYHQEAESLLKQQNFGLQELIVADLQINLAKKCFEAINIQKCEKDEKYKQFCSSFVNNKFVKFLELINSQVDARASFEDLYQNQAT